MIVKNRFFMVVGLGVSGVAVVNLLLKERAAKIAVFDDSVSRVREIFCAFDRDARILPVYNGRCFCDGGVFPDVCIVSPGVSSDHYFVKYLKDRSVCVISEPKLGLSFVKGNVIAVTGTNGKSTVVSMMHEILNCSERRSVLCGNIGKPVCEAVLDSHNRGKSCIFVVEMSSYQLEQSSNIVVDVGVITNIDRDHIERHGSMENYIRIKLDMAWRVKNGGCIVVSERTMKTVEDAGLYGYFSEASSGKNVIVYGDYIGKFANDCYLRENAVYFRGENIVRVKDLRVYGSHNVENVMAVVSSLCVIGVAKDKIIKGLLRFSGVEHRLESVRRKGCVAVINDSKSTNVASGIAGVSAVVERFGKSEGFSFALILGGKSKKEDFGGFFGYLHDLKIRGMLKAVFVYGSVCDELKECAERYGVSDLLSVVKDFYLCVKEGLFFCENNKVGVLLFSPSCPSFDRFADFEERGRVFKAVISEK